MSQDDAIAALDLLRDRAREARTDPEASEAAIKEALALAPDDFDILLGAYRFYFYNHRYRDALPHCAELLTQAARRLNIASDWRLVEPGDAPFSEAEFAPGLFLQTLIAWGYCHSRLGDLEEARAAIAHVLHLDPSDRFGAGGVLGHIEDRLAEAADEAP